MIGQGWDETHVENGRGRGQGARENERENQNWKQRTQWGDGPRLGRIRWSSGTFRLGEYRFNTMGRGWICLPETNQGPLTDIYIQTGKGPWDASELRGGSLLLGVRWAVPVHKAWRTESVVHQPHLTL